MLYLNLHKTVGNNILKRPNIKTITIQTDLQGTQAINMICAVELIHDLIQVWQ